MESLNSLDEALAALDARAEGEYVFATTDTIPAGLEPFATVHEAEGWTVVATLAQAREFGLEDSQVFTRVTPTAVTALSSVGVTAMIAQTFASRAIPCNVIAGYYHDHFFVPADKGHEAVGLLKNLSEQARGWLAD